MCGLGGTAYQVMNQRNSEELKWHEIKFRINIAHVF